MVTKLPLKKPTPVEMSPKATAISMSPPVLGIALSYEGFFSQENSCAEENELKTLFTTFPELNVRQVARNAGINPTLLQQYIDGYKKPSELRIKEIETFLHRLGKELSDISLSKIKD